MRIWPQMFGVSLLALGAAISVSAQKSPAPPRCFELRTYTVPPDKMDALHRRFQDHATRLFKKHGMQVVGFWVDANRSDTLIYVLAHPSCEAAPPAWKAFTEDPDWIAAKTASEKDGALVTKVEKVFMNPTAYSPLK